LQTGYESLRPNCDCGQLTKSTIPARRGRPAKGLLRRLACGCRDLARFAPFLESLHDCEEWRHEQHCQTRRYEHAAEYGDADRHARAGAGTTREHERQDTENEGE